MDNSFFKGKRITVLGLGLHGGGMGAIKFLVKNGARVVVTDIKTKEQLAPSLEKLKGLKNIEYVLGQHRTEDFSKADLVIKNPAVRWDSQYIKLALEKKIPVEMDSSLFFQLCHNPIIGVTGTKGKTTTATMIYEILRAAGNNPIKVGISQESVLDKLELLKKETVVVFELSSWRLSSLGRIKKSPQIAVLTNLLPDHLNYYKSMDEYASDKKNIFLFQKPKDYLIVNNDDSKAKEITTEAKAQIIKYSENKIENGINIFKNDNALYLNDGNDTKKIIEIDKLNIRGGHNVKNLMAAIGAVFAFGVSLEEIKKAIVNLKGVPHRLELVRELGGVKYYNDTAATIPEAAISALHSFSEPIILIAGGSDKNLDFQEYARTMLSRAREIILLSGKGTEKLLAELRKDSRFAEKRIETVDSMEEAVKLAAELAVSGDVILLSPGAASFGLFQNEFDRGEKFRKAVSELKA
jgi:UDP-N-acetylmuramoylalanine--D-glutamate ligase